MYYEVEIVVEEDTKHMKHCTQDNVASVPVKVGTLKSPSAALSYFLESHKWSEILSLSKVTLVLGKARSCRVLNLDCSGAESPGWFAVSPKNSA